MQHFQRLEDPWIKPDSLKDLVRAKDLKAVLEDPNSDIRKSIHSKHLRFQTMLTASGQMFQTNPQITSGQFPEFHVQLVGDSKVGKSSIIKKYVHGKFGEKYEKTDKIDEHDSLNVKTLGQDKLKQV